MVTGWIEHLPMLDNDEETVPCLVIPLAPVRVITVREDDQEGKPNA